MRKTWIFLCAVWMCTSCHYKEKQMAEGIQQLQSQSVDLCTDSMRCLVNGQDTMLFRNKKNLKLVIYSDSTICSTCRMKNMHLWDGLLEESEIYGKSLDFYFIFTPAQKDLRSLELVMRTYSPNCPIYIDTMGIFGHKNPHIPKNAVFHTFLLDKDNKAVLAGDPLEHPEMRALYHQAIQQLLNRTSYKKIP